MEEYCKRNTEKIWVLEEQNKKQIKKIEELVNAQKQVIKKIDKVLPTIIEINDMRNAWTWTGKLMGVVIKIVLGFGIISAAIYSIKEWVKKD